MLRDHELLIGGNLQTDDLREGAEEANMMSRFRRPIAKWTAGLMRPAPTPLSLSPSMGMKEQLRRVVP